MFEPEANRYYMYILSSASGTLPVGVTNDMLDLRRILNGTKEGKRIMVVDKIEKQEAIDREKEIKGCGRSKKGGTNTNEK